MSVQTQYQGKMWSDEVIQELGYILWSCIKKLFNWYSCSTQVKAMHSKAKRREKELYLSCLNQCMVIYACDHGEDYC